MTGSCNLCMTPASLRCAGCKKVYYCSQQCQKQDWGYHKKACSSVPKTEIENKPEPTRSSSASTKPKMLFISLKGSYESTFAGAVYSAIRRTWDLVEVKTEVKAKKELNEKPAVVMITDVAILKYKELFSLVIDYAKKGGMVIFGIYFPSSVTMDKFPRIFTPFGLEWEQGEYHRTTTALRKDNLLTTKIKLPDQYCVKANHIAGVSSKHMIYQPTNDSRTQSFVFGSHSVNQNQTPAALAKVGKGYVGCIGDVNLEDDSTTIILYMGQIALDNKAK